MSFSLGLTDAGLRALKPAVIRVSATGTSAFLVPSTSRSAATDFAGSFKGAALGTSDRWNDRLRRDSLERGRCARCSVFHAKRSISTHKNKP